MDDRDYVRSIYERHDEDAFAAVIDSERRQATAHVRAALGNDAAVEDVLQEADIKAILAFRSGTFDASRAIRPWYGVIVKNAITDYWRSKKALRRDSGAMERRSLDAIGIDDDPAAALMREETCERVGKSLGILSSRQRELVHRIFWKEQSYEYIAGELKLPVGTVKSSVFAAKKELRLVLGNLT